MKLKIVEMKGSMEVRFCSRELEYFLKKSRKNLGKNEYLYLAKDNDIVVGFLYAYLVSRSVELTYHSSVFLEMLMVDKKYRRQGIGTALLEVFLFECYNHNMKIIENDLFYQNDDMGRLYWKSDMGKYCYRMQLELGRKDE